MQTNLNYILITALSFFAGALYTMTIQQHMIKKYHKEDSTMGPVTVVLYLWAYPFFRLYRLIKFLLCKQSSVEE